MGMRLCRGIAEYLHRCKIRIIGFVPGILKRVHTMDVMQAAVNRVYGAPEVITVESIPMPVVGKQEVLIKVLASTVNRTDCGFLRGTPRVVRLISGLSKPRWQVLGCELVGEVIELGSGVSEYTVGDQVIAFKDDDYKFGCHAQFTTMNVAGMIAKILPDKIGHHNIELTHCAAMLEGSHYALSGIRAVGVTADDEVLVNGATGAIGSAAVQLLAELGARVTAVCATDHMDTVKKLGAETVIDYTQQDFTQLKQQFKFVYDAVGKSTYGACKKILKNPLYALLFTITRSKRVMFPIPKNLNSDAQYLASLLHSGAFAPLIDSSYELKDIRDAYKLAETGMKTGNIIINMPS